MNRWAAVVLWVVLIGLGFGFGPPSRPDLGAFVLDLLTGRWGEHEPWVVAEFQLLGLFPALVGLLIRPDWRARLPAWPFVLVSFVLGCYALLPWFFLRTEPRREPVGRFGGPVLPAILALVALVLLIWAAARGDLAELQRVVLSEGFVWAMSWDFVAFWILSVVEARARTRGTPWAITLVPVVGLGVFLAMEARNRRV